MSEFVTSGRAIDLVLAVLAAEAILIALLARRGRGALILSLVPGALLLLALRAALGGWGWEAVATFVALSLPAHLADMRARLRAPT